MLGDPRHHLSEMIDELPRYVDKIAPGSTVVDLGANVGVFTIYAAERAGRVVAVEPSPRHYRALEKNVASLHNVKTVHAAVWTHDGTARLFEDQSNFTMDRIDYHGTAEDAHEVPCLTLPTLFREHGLDHVDFLKMDIEGAELDVLQHPSFAEAAPMIGSMWVEVHNYKDWIAVDEIWRQVAGAAQKHLPKITENTWCWFFASR